LDDETLPQVSDAVLMMVQFETALAAFKERYHKHVYGNWFWITKESLAELGEEEHDDDTQETES
jgi:hypothetical protein